MLAVVRLEVGTRGRPRRNEDARPPRFPRTPRIDEGNLRRRRRAVAGGVLPFLQAVEARHGLE